MEPGPPDGQRSSGPAELEPFSVPPNGLHTSFRTMRACLIAALCLLLAPPSLAGQEWSAGRAYEAYETLLSRYLTDGEIDYAQWVADDPPSWHQFLDWLANARPEFFTVDQQRAFWINAYNARLIASVIARYPIGSVREVGFLGGRVRGFFGKTEHRVAGQTWTLDEIEQHLRRRPLWDPRIHFVLVCGARDCPRLRSEPYVSRKLDMQLDFQTRTFLNSPRGHRLDRDDGKIYLSRILEWHEGDFERAAGSTRAYAARYLTGVAAEAALDETYDIEYLDFDWTLNDTR